MLVSGEVDLGICQVCNCSVGNEMEWWVLGVIDMDFYVVDVFFVKVVMLVLLFDFFLVLQVVMYVVLDELVVCCL